MKSFEKYRGEEFVGVAALAAAAETAIREFCQSKDNVEGKQWEAPNSRTIRFYLTEGLLPKAEDTDGTRSVFTYRHLVTLMVIRRMQALGIPIKIIRQIVITEDINRLEELVTESVNTTTDIREANLARQSGEQVMMVNDPEDIWTLRAMPDLDRGMISFRRVGPPSMKSWSRQRMTSARHEVWDRYTVDEGVEIHFSRRSDMSDQEKRRLVREVRRLAAKK
jgi:DNA-binding transcriptional MerR regulator